MRIEQWKPLLASPKEDMISLQLKINEVIGVVNQLQEKVSETDRAVEEAGEGSDYSKGLLGDVPKAKRDNRKD